MYRYCNALRVTRQENFLAFHYLTPRMRFASIALRLA
jgi:hypothetical protein